MSDKPLVAILMGSTSDLDLMRPASDTLAELGIAHTMRVRSAHRTPEQTAEMARGARADGLRVFICADDASLRAA